jgi:hypothetical protein
LVDGKLLKTIDQSQLNKEGTEEFYSEIIHLPASLLTGKDHITIKFQGRGKNATAGLMDLRIVVQ